LAKIRTEGIVISLFAFRFRMKLIFAYLNSKEMATGND